MVGIFIGYIFAEIDRNKFFIVFQLPEHFVGIVAVSEKNPTSKIEKRMKARSFFPWPFVDQIGEMRVFVENGGDVFVDNLRIFRVTTGAVASEATARYSTGKIVPSRTCVSTCDDVCLYRLKYENETMFFFVGNDKEALQSGMLPLPLSQMGKKMRDVGICEAGKRQDRQGLPAILLRSPPSFSAFL